MRDNKKSQLVKNTIIIGIGQVSTKFISFFLLPLYTALLTTEEYGTVDLLNTYISLLMPVVFLQIDQAIFRFLIDSREDERHIKKLLSTSFLSICIQTILYLIVFSLIGKLWTNQYKIFLATNVVISMLSSYCLQVTRGLGDNVTYSIGSLIAGVSTVALNVIFIAVFGLGALGMLLASFIANLLCFLFVFLKKKMLIYIHLEDFDKNELKAILRYSVPLIPNMLSWWIVNLSDRILITYMMSSSFNGIYSAANKLSAIIITIYSIFNLTWSESTALHIRDDDCGTFFSDIIDKAFVLFLGIIICLIATMPFVFQYLITGEGYKNAYYQIPILLISTIFNILVSLIGSVYLALKKSDEIAKTSFFAAIINFLVNLILISKIGLYAASLSTLVAYLAMAIYRLIDIQKYVKIKLKIKTLVIYSFLLVVVLLAYYFKNQLICLITIFVSYLIFFMLNLDMINKIFTFVKKKVSWII
ncbi:oligosaccharide flippase family protein [Desulfosporosinus sp. FKB]|uniref:oligosaccharide flippase family protein n=1 Tax=Desulfosporosinus sp. FKB TaxID=1969835 RepID=UPI000B4A151E|nr:oligosaccharide flippase family protein [Desulfosporosinus sp. FKB]